jgi:hypothetical protein
MLSIIESMGKTWAAVAAQGDLRLYERDESEWVEIELQANGSQPLDEDAALVLDALYEQVGEPNGVPPLVGEEDEEPDEDDEQEDEPEASEDEEDEPEEKPKRSSRGRQSQTRRAKAGAKK